MKNFFQLSIAVLLAGTVLVSCGKDDDDDEDTSVLGITNIVAENHDGSGSNQVNRGGMLKIDFEATAGPDANLDYYHIELHDHPASGLIEDEYRIIDQTFENEATFKGLKNASVHQHVPVADTANLGAYHGVIVVVDENGNSVDTEDGDTEIMVVQ